MLHRCHRNCIIVSLLRFFENHIEVIEVILLAIKVIQAQKNFYYWLYLDYIIVVEIFEHFIDNVLQTINKKMLNILKAHYL